MDGYEVAKTIILFVILGLVLIGMIVALLSIFIEEFRGFVALTFLYWMAVGLIAGRRLREHR